MDERNVYDNTEQEVDLLELMHILLSKFWILLIMVIIGAAAAVGFTILFITPQYESTTKMYVLTKQSSDTLNSQDMQTSLSLTKDYEELIKSRTVTEDVISELDLDLTHEELLNKMTVESADDTRVLTISVRDPDPYMAQQIADAIRDVSANHIKNVMDIDAVNVVDKANMPENTVSPSLLKNGILGAAAGFFIAAAAIIIAFITNDTIKNQDDVERYLGLSTLGLIPLDAEEQKYSKNKKSRKKKRRGPKK